MIVELDVFDLGRSVDFYVSALGFTIAVDRPERKFAYLTRNGRVDLMLQSADGPGKRLRIAALERPFGRGVSLVIPCDDVGALFSAVVAYGGGEVITPIEERTTTSTSSTRRLDGPNRDRAESSTGSSSSRTR